MHPGWIPLCTEEDWEQFLKLSESEPVLAFKHSTRCMISSRAYGQIQHLDAEQLRIGYLDVISCRELSGAVALYTNIAHASPQVLLLYKRACLWHTSHMGITQKAVVDAVAACRKSILPE